jgi:hypothetical protein
MARWHDLGPVEKFRRPVTAATVGTQRLAITNLDGRYGPSPAPATTWADRWERGAAKEST